MVPESLAPLGLVAVGGAAGSLARYGVGELMGGTAASTTLLVNLAGAFALGVLFSLVERATGAGRHADHWWLLLGTGVLGGFTTYSGLAVATAELLADGHGWWALAYAGGTLIAGLAASVTGIWIGRAGKAHEA